MDTTLNKNIATIGGVNVNTLHLILGGAALIFAIR